MECLRPSKFVKHLEIDFGNQDRRMINPISIKEELENKTGNRIGEVVGTSRTKLYIKSSCAEQTSKCLEIDRILGHSCKILPHPTFNSCKGLIRLRQFEMIDMEEFAEHLSDQYDVKCVEKADFIKSRYGETAYIVTFNEDQLPYSVYIPGEISDTAVSPFNSRPMMCKKCLN